MAKVTLDQYRKAADEKYASFEIALDSKTTVTLRNPLRIGDEKVLGLEKSQQSVLGSSHIVSPNSQMQHVASQRSDF